MKILLTGAAGFIGSHLGERLILDGHEVIGVDNFDPFYPRKFKEDNLKKLNASNSFSFFEADIRDNSALQKIFRENKYDMVIHLAAKAGVRPSMLQIASYYEVNINGTLNLLECMKHSKVSKFIFASSSSVYGNNKKVPFSESDPVDHPISPYAATKKSGELLCHVYSHLYNFDITCLRFFTVFGPRQRPDLAIHKFIRLIDEGKPIPFFGDGSTARDYTYIDDIVGGIMCSINKLRGYNIYNLGESRTITLFQMVRSIENLLNKKATLEHLPPQQGDVDITYADISKARKELDYDPKFNFETGLKKFIEWYHDSKNLIYS
ncbi:MAG: GDP-mannose 4,6-dehydratase [Chitinophagales bacterium]|nr:GDP-mannose 4,6-dehydratase [Chitinophagales bacterium]